MTIRTPGALSYNTFQNTINHAILSGHLGVQYTSFNWGCNSHTDNPIRQPPKKSFMKNIKKIIRI
jgi:hypothetical protein